MLKIVLASNNKHKLSEFQGCFAQKGIEAEIIPLSATDFCGDIPEDAETFEGNAYIKAKTISDYTGAIVIADDSGLCVDALNGAPGVYSARYAEGGGDKANTEKLLAERALRAKVTIEQKTHGMISEVSFFCQNDLVSPRSR